jgi:hypothetical protein
VSSATDKRLDKIEANLTPQAAFLLWLPEAQQYPTMTAHATALKDAPDSSYPLYRLPQQVETAVRAAHKGEKPEVISRAVRQSVRDVAYLYYLHSEVNTRLMGEWRGMCLQVALAASHLGPVFRTDTPDPEALAWAHRITRTGLAELLEWEAATRILAMRSFGGQTPLYPAWAEQLAAMVTEAEQITALFNDHLDRLAFLAENAHATTRTSTKKRKQVLTPLVESIDLDALRIQAQAGGKELARHIVAMAQAEALRFMGENHQALALVKARLWPEDE